MKKSICFFILFCGGVVAYGQNGLSLGFDNGHPDGVKYVAASKDGKVIYALGGGYLKTWEVATHRVLHSTPLKLDDEYNVVMDVPSNRLFVIIGQRIHILELATGQPVDTIAQVVVYNRTAMALHPQNPILAFTSESGHDLYLYDLAMHRLVKTISDFRNSQPIFLQYLPDGKSLLLGTNEAVPDKDGKNGPALTKIFDATNYHYIKTIDSESYYYSLGKLSGNGKWWITYNLSLGSLKIWRVSDLQLVKSTHIVNGFNLDLSPDSQEMIVGQQNHLVRYSLPDAVAIDTFHYPKHKLSWLQSCVSYLPDGLTMVAGYQTGSDNLLIWDKKSHRAYPFQSEFTNSTLVMTSRTGKYFVTAGTDNSLRIWNPRTGDLLYLLQGHMGAVKCMDFNDADTVLVSGDEDGKIISWNLKTGRIMQTSSEHRGWVTSLSFGADNNLFASAGLDNTIRIWNTHGKQSVYILQKAFLSLPVDSPNDAFGVAIFDHHGHLYASGIGQVLDKWLWRNGQLSRIKSVSVYPKTLVTLTFNKGEHYLVTGANDNQNLFLIDTASLAISLYATFANRMGIACDRFHNRILMTSVNAFDLALLDLDTHQQWLYNDAKLHPPVADFNAAGGFISAGTGNAISLWSGLSPKVVLNYYPFAGTRDFVAVNKDNYYRTTRKGAQSIFFTYGNKKFQFEQFDMLLDRPDLITAAWPGAYSAMISLLKTSYHRRLQQLGIDSAAIELKLKDIPDLQLSIQGDKHFTNEATVSVHLRAAAGQSGLIRLMVWDNNAPVFGTEGIKIDGRHTQLDTIVQVPLVAGINQISAEVLNNNFTASPIMSAEIACNAAFPRPKLFLLVLGVNKFDDPALPSLDFAEKDASDFRSSVVKLHQLYGDGDTVVLSLTGTAFANKKAIMRKINEFLSQADINDKAVVYFSTHGLVADKPRPGNYLALQDTRVDDLTASGLLIDSLEQLISGIVCRNKAIFLDACHSGQTPATVMREQSHIGDTPGNRFKDGNNMLLASDDAFSLMESLFMDIKRTGVTIISASGGLQRADENPSIRNGAFTGVLLHGLTRLSAGGRHYVTIKELMDFVIEELPKTGFKQRPTFRSENLVNDFDL